MCEKCSVRPKSREVNEDGEQITHRYCGILCYEAAQRSIPPSSTIPAPVVSFEGGKPLKFCIERSDTPIGRKILLTMEERWESKEACNPQLRCIYRLDLKGEVYRRFDLALQMNHGCPVQTTYYGGLAKCSIADDQEPATCESELCRLCDALRSSFGNLPYGASSRDGLYGLGLYSYTNPAVAHDAAISGDDQGTQATQYALIQCRVITQSNSTPNSNAGFIDDSGVVFCAQPMAVIPTHLLVYRLAAAPTIKDSRAANRGTFPTPATDAPYNRSPASYAHIEDKDYLESNSLSRDRSARLNSTVSLDEEDDDFDFLTAGKNVARRRAQSNLEEEDDDFY
ncbi:hypothetical protein FRC05_011626 [Tulasnella sp. 425]|nr:hypothetical protein FRC05_011626 [Tulasnella sp. 425]